MTAEERAAQIVEEHLGKDGSGYVDEDASSADWLRSELRKGVAQTIQAAIVGP